MDCGECAGATILPGVCVGKHAVVGVGNAVTKDVPDYAVVGFIALLFLNLACNAQNSAPEFDLERGTVTLNSGYEMRRTLSRVHRVFALQKLASI